MTGQMNRGEDIEFYADRAESREAARMEAAAEVDVHAQDGNWISGTVTIGGDAFSFSAKTYPEFSTTHGITSMGADGYVSKLTVNTSGGSLLMDYDRGWNYGEDAGDTAAAVVRVIDRYAKNELDV